MNTGNVAITGGVTMRLNGEPVGVAKTVNGLPVWVWKVRNWARPGFLKGWLAKHFAAPLANKFGVMTAIAELRAVLRHPDGTKIDLGVLSYRVITNAAVAEIVDEMQDSTGDIDLFDYHDCGTGSTAEAATQTALVTPFGGSRVAGTPGEGASANIYQSVAQISFTSTQSIVEHGLFNASTAGILFDRSLFASIGVENGSDITFTYEVTFTAGS